MTFEAMQKKVATYLDEKRNAHVLRVVDMAEKLAERHGISVERAKQAALLHDVAKNMPKEELRQAIEQSGRDLEVLNFHHELWHAKVGAMIAKDEFNIEEECILDAIRYHTTGRAQMTSLEMVIYLADLVEEGRNFPTVEQLRQVAFDEVLEDAMAIAIRHSIQFLASKSVAIYPDSFECYNEHMLRKGK